MSFAARRLLLLDNASRVVVAPAPSVTDGAALWVDTSKLSSMFQEGGSTGGNPVTPVTANGDPVGCIYDMSANAMLIRAAASAGQWPILGSDATRNGFLTFDGSNDRIVLQNTPILNNIHSAAPSFSIYFWLKMNGGDAAVQLILTNNNSSATATGFALSRTAANKIKILTAAGGATKTNFTSTQSVAVATGWVPIILSFNGAGTGKGRLVIGEIEDSTFDTVAGGSADATEGMWIGSRSSGVQYLNGSIGDILILPTPATTNLITAFKAYNPTRTLAEFTPMLQFKYDFNDTTRMFSDAAGTTPVVANSVVRLVNSAHTEIFGTMRRTLTAISDSTAPIYKTSQVNGRSTILFDGVDDNLDFTSQFCNELGGKYVVFVVVRNTRAALGSHFLSGDKYMVLTGQDYAVGVYPDPYFAIHTSLPAGTTNVPPIGTTDATYRLMAFRRNGTEMKHWNGIKETYTDALIDGTGSLSFTDMGQQYDKGDGSDWWFGGYMAFLEKWNGLFSDAAVEARIDALNTQFGL